MQALLRFQIFIIPLYKAIYYGSLTYIDIHVILHAYLYSRMICSRYPFSKPSSVLQPTEQLVSVSYVPKGLCEPYQKHSAIVVKAIVMYALREYIYHLAEIWFDALKIYIFKIQVTQRTYFM